MGRRIEVLVDRIREAKGPFFLARLCLRVSFSFEPGQTADTPERERELVDACRALGFDPLEMMDRASPR
jgi:hypothetical protein